MIPAKFTGCWDTIMKLSAQWLAVDAKLEHQAVRKADEICKQDRNET